MRLLLVGVEPAAERILRSELQGQYAMDRVDIADVDGWDDVDGIVVGLPGPQALLTMERVYKAVPQAPVMVLASGERLAEVSRQVRFAPMLGSRTSWAASDDEEAVRAAGRAFARKAAERQTLNAGVEESNQRLAGQLPRLARLSTSDLLSQVMQHAPVGILVVDPLGRTVLGSARAAAMLGSLDTDARFADRFPGKEGERCREMLEAAASGNVSRQVLHVAAGAGVREVEVTAIPAGDITMLFFRDASAESELQDSVEEARVNEALSRLAGAFSRELDRRRLLQLVVDEATALVAAPFGVFFLSVGDETGGAHLLRAFSSPDAARFAELPRAREDGVVRVDDVTRDPRFGPRGIQPESGPRVRSYLAVPVPSPSGGTLGELFFGHPEVGHFNERHERLVQGVASHAAIALENARLHAMLRERETQLIAACEAAQASHRRKDEFLALLGHELRNPLAPIATATELIKLKDDGTLLEERSIIERQVRHLARLVDDLLDVSRITRGRLDLEREHLEIAGVLARAIEMASPALEQKSQHLEIDVARDGLPVHGDPVRLAQVFQNLLSNAARYSGPGGHIRVSARAEGGHVLVVVTDDGIGIPEALLPGIFDTFVQGERVPGRSEGGLGIGLTIVRSLVELHQGEVSAKSGGPNRGSEFTVRLPLASVDAVPGARVDPAESAASSASARRVLVVDDSVDGATALAEFLRMAGHRVDVAHDGPSALEMFRCTPPDTAILDIGLPLMDGYELAGRMREMAKGPLLLVALTGYGQDEDRARSSKAGFDQHFTKPVDPRVLRRLLL